MHSFIRRPRKFLSLILILLVINVLFFSIWYPLGGRDWVRDYLAQVIGKAAKAEVSIGDLHFSDKQILVQDFSYASNDSLINLTVDSVRVRYNLYKLILSGFKPENVVTSVEIIKPTARIQFHQGPKTDKPRKPKSEPFRIPDLTGYFKRITLENGSIEADLAFELKMLNDGPLRIEEGLSNIELRVLNSGNTNIKLSAVSSLGGTFSLEGTLDDGRIDIAKVDIEDFKPLYVAHPDIQDFRTEINLSGSYSEPADSSAARFEGKALIWNTSAFAIQNYQVRIPLINLQTDGQDATLSLSRSRIGQSSIVANLAVQNFMDKMSFNGSSAQISLDASDILPELSGLVEAELSAAGTIADPLLKLDASSLRFAYQDWAVEDIQLSASYQDDVAELSIPLARWMNQAVSLQGAFYPQTLSFDAQLETAPLQTKDQDLLAKGSLAINGIILKPYPLISLSMDNMDFMWQDLDLRGISGRATLMPLAESLLASVDLKSAEGFTISAVGDILSRHISLDATFDEFQAAKLYHQQTLGMLNPLVSGKLSAIMTGNTVWYSGDLFTKLLGDYDYQANLDLIGSVDISGPAVAASIKTQNALFNGLPADLTVNMDYADNKIKVSSLIFEDILNLSAEVDFADLWNSSFDIALKNIDSARISRYYPDVAYLVPDFRVFNLFATYNQHQDQHLDAWINLQNVDLISIVPINLNLFLKGSPEEIAISGSIKNRNNNLLLLSGTSSVLPKMNLALDLVMNDLKIQNVLTADLGLASISGKAAFAMKDILSENPEMEVSADLIAKDMQFGEFSIDMVAVKAAQLSTALVVDSLYIHADEMFTAHAKGSLDYNVFQSRFYEGNRSLELVVDGEFFPWLKNMTSFVRESRGISNVKLTLGTAEEQFTVLAGNINLEQGYIHLKDQVEAMRDIEISGVFENNRFMIQRGSFTMGNGKFFISNMFDAEPSDHFTLGILDLGYYLILIEEPGIQATIPVVAPPRTLTNIAIQGIDSRYATIRGPFDDMKIEARVTVSNLDILFPPGADNLLNLIMSVRSTGKKPDTDPVPLPFKLDLQLTIGENVRYVTYPTNLYLSPGGFLHLIYDGNRFIVEEANIVSDRGSIDFFGTIFQVDNIAISMIDQQNILSANGYFFKRTPDGSTITLTVTSSPEYDKGFFDRLQISLSSDNPQDQNIAQVLSRLRYDQSMDSLPNGEKQNLFQDEALGLIGGNLNSTVLTPFFYPVENWIRRTLKLDGFSINAGFIKNIFTEYSSNPSGLADMADLSNLSSDISQFSSAILLNNLSLSMSKYLGYRLFADYELGLQEATDLQQRTRLLVSHDTSLRLVLPRQFRIGYTLNYSPKDTGFTHEVLLQKSWRFWGF
jgi:hypothetical protein